MDSDGLSSDDVVDPDDDDDDDAYAEIVGDAELVGDAVDGAPRRRRAPRTDRTDRPLVPFGFVGKRLGVAPPPSVAPIVGPEDVEADDLADVLRLLAICRAKASLSYVEKCRAKAAAENRVAVLTDFNLTEEGVRDGGRTRAKRDASGELLHSAEKREARRLVGVAERVSDAMLADGLELRERVELFDAISAEVARRLPKEPIEVLEKVSANARRLALNKRAGAAGDKASRELVAAIAERPDKDLADVRPVDAPKPKVPKCKPRKRKAAAAPEPRKPKAQKVPKLAAVPP